MEILTSVRRLYISFKSLVNDFVYSFGRAALLLLVEVLPKFLGNFSASVCRILHIEVASTSKILFTVNSATL